MEVKFLKKKYEEKWKNAWWQFKGSPASGVGPRPPDYKVMYVQNKQILKKLFVEMPRICCIEIDIL